MAREYFGHTDGAYGGGRDTIYDVVEDSARMDAARSRLPEPDDDRPTLADEMYDNSGDAHDHGSAWDED